MAVSVVQNPPFAIKDEPVTLTAKVNDSDVASPVTWSEVHSIKGETRGTYGEIYVIKQAQRGGTYKATVGSESADFELQFPSTSDADGCAPASRPTRGVERADRPLGGAARER